MVRLLRPKGKNRPILPTHPGIKEKTLSYGLAGGLDEPRAEVAVAAS